MLIEKTISVKKLAIELTKGGLDARRIMNEGTQLSVLEKEFGNLYVEQLLSQLICDFNASHNLVRPMTTTHIADLIEDILLEYWYYTLEDFICFFHLMKRGQLGSGKDQVFDHLDDTIIHKFLTFYDNLRVNQINRTTPNSPTEWKPASEVVSPTATIVWSAEEILQFLSRPATKQDIENKLGREISDEEFLIMVL